MAAIKKENVVRATYQMSEESLKFLEAFNEQTHLSKHKIVSFALEFAAENKDSYFKFVFKAAISE